MKRNGLTARFCKTVKPADRVKRYADGGGLLLVVQPTGAKSWIARLMIGGRRRDIGLGALDFVTLAEAREACFDLRRAARTGAELPIRTRTPARTMPTFAEALDATLAVHGATWKNAGRTERHWRSMMERHAGGFMGRPVDSITTADVLAVVSPLWTPQRATAKLLRQRIGAVMKWAAAAGHRPDNPAGDALGAALPRGGARVEHHAAVPHADLADVLAAVAEADGWPTAKLAVRFAALTGARSAEVRGATWAEVDHEARTWTIPAARTKNAREHRVPLSAAAVAVLAEARELTDGSPLVFPSARGGELGDRTLGNFMRPHGATVHGLRSSLRDWCGETGVPREVAEACLAHVVKGVEGSYARSDLLDRRRPVMARWGAYLTGERAAKVVRLRA